jgi:hypothetical protein
MTTPTQCYQHSNTCPQQHINACYDDAQIIVIVRVVIHRSPVSSSLHIGRSLAQLVAHLAASLRRSSAVRTALGHSRSDESSDFHRYSARELTDVMSQYPASKPYFTTLRILAPDHRLGNLCRQLHVLILKLGGVNTCPFKPRSVVTLSNGIRHSNGAGIFSDWDCGRLTDISACQHTYYHHNAGKTPDLLHTTLLSPVMCAAIVLNVK